MVCDRGDVGLPVALAVALVAVVVLVAAMMVVVMMVAVGAETVMKASSLNVSSGFG